MRASSCATASRAPAVLPARCPSGRAALLQADHRCGQPQAAPDKASSAAPTKEPRAATPPQSDANAAQGERENPSLAPIFAAMGAVLVSVGAFYAFAFLASDLIAGQVQEPVSKLVKKDFIPYSQRREMERNLLIAREEQDAQAARDGEADEEDEQSSSDSRTMTDLAALSDLQGILPGK